MYNTKKQAARAAKDRGLLKGAFTIEPKDGKFVIVMAIPETDADADKIVADAILNAELTGELALLTTDEALDKALGEAGNLVADVPPVVQPSPTAGAAVLPEPAIVMPTDAATPFAFIWTFLSLNPEVSRKRQIAAMIAHGINENTVKTQVSRYNKHGGDKAGLLAAEKAKRAAERAHIDTLVAKIQADRAEQQAIAGAAAVAS